MRHLGEQSTPTGTIVSRIIDGGRGLEGPGSPAEAVLRDIATEVRAWRKDFTAVRFTA